MERYLPYFRVLIIEPHSALPVTWSHSCDWTVYSESEKKWNVHFYKYNQ